eukprot:s2220_g11.t1
MALRWAWAAVALAEGEIESLDVPNSLSCGLQQGWPSVAAALSVEAGQGPEPGDALPRMCQTLDLDLVKWMVGEVLNLAWAENTSDAVQDFYEEQYYCEPRLDKILREEVQECRAAVSSTVHSACLYGSASIFACILSMLFRHPQKLDAPDLLSSMKLSLLAIRWFMHSEHRWMEFLDSSDWPVTLTDLVNIMDAYGDVLALEDLNNASSSTVRGLLRQSRKPWNAGSFSWLKATLAAKQSLAAVHSWRVASPSTGGSTALASRVAVRLWAFGTHCSVMAEPVSVMTTLLSEEFQINVSWQGASDYCQYHHGARPDGHSDSNCVCPICRKSISCLSLVMATPSQNPFGGEPLVEIPENLKSTGGYKGDEPADGMTMEQLAKSLGAGFNSDLPSGSGGADGFGGAGGGGEEQDGSSDNGSSDEDDEDDDDDDGDDPSPEPETEAVDGCPKCPLLQKEVERLSLIVEAQGVVIANGWQNNALPTDRLEMFNFLETLKETQKQIRTSLSSAS